ncbi:MAG: tRNA (adenosine(37)-N6)-threonylcarbamoyltransferase complex transferase subunit TsaD [Microgenomates group bacterium]
MKILAIETSCDDTCAAVLENDRVISNVISSQTDLHKDWGGVVPDIAKRAHQARILPVIMTALKRSQSLSPSGHLPLTRERKTLEYYMKSVDVIAVTKGPGLAIALGVGVKTACELAIKYNKKLVAVNHVEGHILSNLVKNSKGLPEREIELPAICLTVSGGHTKIVLLEKGDHKGTPLQKYTVVGETLDDAAGEALDKAAKLLGLGYPGGPVIERLAMQAGANNNLFELPKPLADKKVLDYSFSGLKTSFYYKIKDWSIEEKNKNLASLAATFQESVFNTLIRKFDLAIDKYEPKTIMASGGVLANMMLRKKLRALARKKKLLIYMPAKIWLNTDNAAMIGRVGWELAKRKEWSDPETLDRDPRLNF